MKLLVTLLIYEILRFNLIKLWYFILKKIQ
jgi:hypothetical protein